MDAEKFVGHSMAFLNSIEQDELLLPTSSASHVNSKFDCITVKHQGRNPEQGEKVAGLPDTRVLHSFRAG